MPISSPAQHVAPLISPTAKWKHSPTQSSYMVQQVIKPEPNRMVRPNRPMQTTTQPSAIGTSVIRISPVSRDRLVVSQPVTMSWSEQNPPPRHPSVVTSVAQQQQQQQGIILQQALTSNNGFVIHPENPFPEQNVHLIKGPHSPHISMTTAQNLTLVHKVQEQPVDYAQPQQQQMYVMPDKKYVVIKNNGMEIASPPGHMGHIIASQDDKYRHGLIGHLGGVAIHQPSQNPPPPASPSVHNDKISVLQQV